MWCWRSGSCTTASLHALVARPLSGDGDHPEGAPKSQAHIPGCHDPGGGRVTQEKLLCIPFRATFHVIILKFLFVCVRVL